MRYASRAAAFLLLLAVGAFPAPRANAGPQGSAELVVEAQRLEKEGRRDEALRVYDRLVAAFPRPSSYLDRGRFLLRLGRPTDARRDFDAALAILPSSIPARYAHGEALLAEGNAAGARVDADAVLAAAPRHVDALVLRGMSRRELGDLVGSLDDLRLAVALAPERSELLRTIDAIDGERRRGGAVPLDDPKPPTSTPTKPPPPLDAPDAKPPTTPPVRPGDPISKPKPPPPAPPSSAGGLLLADVPTSVRIRAPEDPLDPKAEPKGDVLWSPPGADLPTEATTEPAIDVPGRISWTSFDPVAYAAAVTAAKEGLRVVQGPMTADQHRRYEEKWLPYYDLPTPEIVQYFNALMPVLERFLAARAGVSATAQTLTKLMLEAGVCERAGDAEGLEAALFRARVERRELDAYRAALAEAVREIEALGNPPNPYEARRRRRKAYDDARAALSPGGPLWWVLSKVEVHEDPCGPDARMRVNASNLDGFAAVVRSYDDLTGTPEEAKYVRWRLPRVVPYAGGRGEARPGEPGFAAKIEIELGGSWHANLRPDLTEEAARLFTATRDLWLAASLDRTASLGMNAAPYWASCGMGLQGRYGPDDPRVGQPTSWAGRAAATIDSVRVVRAKPKDEKEALAERMGLTMLSALEGGPKVELEKGENWRRGDWRYFGKGRYDLDVSVAAHVGGCTFVHHYHYELKDADETERARVEAEGARIDRIAQAEADAFAKRHGMVVAFERAKLENEDEQKKAPTATPKNEPPKPPTKTPEQLAAEEAKAAAVAFQEASIAYFEENLRRDREEYDRTTDPDRRKDLMMRILSADANAQAAKDQLSYLKTGEWVRTRTAYDAWNFERMLERSREEAARITEPDRVSAGISKQIDLLPFDERAAMRDDVRRMLGADSAAWRDPAKLREVHKTVAERVQARWAKEAGDEAFKAKVYRGIELTLEGTKIVSGILVLGVGGYGVAAAGGSATMAWAAETLLGAAYGGATGYVEGGVVEASRQSLQWAGMLGFVSSEALDGYAETGTLQGAGDRAAKAYLFGKALEFGAKWGIGKFLGKGGAGAEEARALEEAFAHGDDLVQAAARSEWAVADALSRGAPMHTVEALTRDAERAAAAIQASWPAKILLKRTGASIAAAGIGERVEKLVATSLDDVTEGLRRMGYSEADVLRFRQFRNPSSTGSFGMDLDLGLVETPGMVITKNGRRVSLSTLHTDAQRAMNASWQARTGFSAEESMINMTTSNHREAFARAMLRDEIPFEALTREDLRRASDVLRTKVTEINLPPIQRRIEQCRTLAKEMRTKMMPYLEHRLARARAAGDKAALAKLEGIKATWDDIYRQVDQIGNREPDPGRVWSLLREFDGSTGGRTIEEVVNDLANGWDILATYAGR